MGHHQSVGRREVPPDRAGRTIKKKIVSGHDQSIPDMNATTSARLRVRLRWAKAIFLVLQPKESTGMENKKKSILKEDKNVTSARTSKKERKQSRVS